MEILKQSQSKILPILNKKKLFREIIISYNLDKKEIELLNNSQIITFVVDYPFIANQDFPDKMAVLNAGNIIAAYRNNNFFKTGKNQSIKQRVSLCLHQTNDDPKIREAAILLLELVSLQDHKNDRKTDLIEGKFNPLNENIISFFHESSAIEKKLKETDLYTKEKLKKYFKSLPSMNYWL